MIYDRVIWPEKYDPKTSAIYCYRWLRIRPSVLCYPILLHGTPLHSHSIILTGRNALNSKHKFFLHTMKNRLHDPSEIFALDFKREFRRFGICSVSVSIGIDRSILGVSTEKGWRALCG